MGLLCCAFAYTSASGAQGPFLARRAVSTRLGVGRAPGKTGLPCTTQALKHACRQVPGTPTTRSRSPEHVGTRRQSVRLHTPHPACKQKKLRADRGAEPNRGVEENPATRSALDRSTDLFSSAMHPRTP
eukprot:CAMPEP_0179099372 /NCGR_PEP_ID=MMETSP0796-20121207/45841_1 /TAXON_ID=73915 /ORGANISM="Pyrodinium bahamense, Strain pbaha01" /LENGTH=128 /DNA_ID=CAMNT_0020797171 /DNA_START=1 /DNA_END=387 /DNA_ORIENTATION=-